MMVVRRRKMMMVMVLVVLQAWSTVLTSASSKHPSSTPLMPLCSHFLFVPCSPQHVGHFWDGPGTCVLAAPVSLGSGWPEGLLTLRSAAVHRCC